MRDHHARRSPLAARPRLLVVLLGAAVTAALVGGLVWSIWQGPSACARWIDVEVDGSGHP